MNRRILVVEDDPINRKAMAAILRFIPETTVIFEEDGDRVLAEAASGDAAVILMDVSLSGTRMEGKPVDGVRLTQAIKAAPASASVPVVLVTASAMVGDRERFLQMSRADAYVPKPIEDIDEFLTLVRRLTGLSQAVPT